MHSSSTLATAVNKEGHCLPDKYSRQKKKKNSLPGVICQSGSCSVSFLGQQTIMVVVQVTDKNRTKQNVFPSFTLLSSVIIVLSKHFYSSIYLSLFYLNNKTLFGISEYVL